MQVGSATAGGQDPQKPVNVKPKLALDAAFKKSKSGLEFYVEKYGSGDKIEKGKKVTVHYEGWLAEDYTLFDSSRKKRRPFEFVLGQGQVIAGWEEALEGVRVGSVLQLKIPSNLGYGVSGHSGAKIPPNSDLIFKVQVMRAK
ncbi:MAG: FKBP-type peptidyl-prolyl cis-trans isomerase [SAR324 cluster bacterium]|nr:FKBP-type peptidyl-prolyl cis-trans isomerase [SAR324 cluster bacterium]